MSIFDSHHMKTPLLLQMEPVECGVTSLAIVLAHYGRWVKIEELRRLANLTRNGISAMGVVRAAKAQGLQARVLSREIDALSSLVFPLIIFWEFNHFIVLEKIVRNKFFINDPARGPRVISAAEFGRSFTGITIEVKPAENFSRNAEGPSLLRYIKNFLSQSRGLLLDIALAQTALILPSLIIPALSSLFIEEIHINKSEHWLIVILSVVAISILLSTFLTGLKQLCLAYLQERIFIRASAEFFERALSLPLRFYVERSSSDLAWRNGYVRNVSEVLSQEVAPVLFELCLAIFWGALLFLIDWRLSWVVVFFVFIAIVGCLWLRPLLVGSQIYLMQMRAEFMENVTGGIQSLAALKAMALFSGYLEKFFKVAARKIQAESCYYAAQRRLGFVLSFIRRFGEAVILVWGVHLAAHREISLGNLVAYFTISAAFFESLVQVLSRTGEDVVVQAQSGRIADVTQSEEDSRKVGKVEQIFFSAEDAPILKVQNLVFGYTAQEKPLLSNVSFSIQQGEQVAVLGKNGCGKSSLLQILSGLYTPWQGKIEISGRDLEKLSYGELSQRLGILRQEIMFWKGTVKENLTFWQDSFSQEKLYSAAQDALIHEVILKRRGGYSALVEEQGKNFSQGERQRLDLARALLKNPQLLILDESTAGLEPKLENQILKNLRRRNVSTLCVTHRLESLAQFDRILILQEGVLVFNGDWRTLQHSEQFSFLGKYRQ